jgi:transposase-like protein
MTQFKSTSDLGALTEEAARAMLESIRWPDGVPICTHCAGNDLVRLKGKSHRPNLFHCRKCKGRTSVLTGTVMESSKIPVRLWVLAMAACCSARLGISGLELSRHLGVTRKTGWFMYHRINEAFRPTGKKLKLTGTVEADEIYIGGAPRGRRKDGTKPKRGRGTEKIPVMAMVARNGENGAVKFRVLPGVGKKVFHDTVKNRVHTKARLLTDEHSSYVGLGEHFKGGHYYVAHGNYEWTDGDVYTNTVESFFRLVRGTFKTHYNWGGSRKHIHRHMEAIAFSWRNRGKGDVERTMLALKQADGKRLRYDQLTR